MSGLLYAGSRPSTPDDLPEKISIPHAAQIANRSKKCIYNWIEREHIKVSRNDGSVKGPKLGEQIVITKSLLEFINGPNSFQKPSHNIEVQSAPTGKSRKPKWVLRQKAPAALKVSKKTINNLLHQKRLAQKKIGEDLYVDVNSYERQRQTTCKKNRGLNPRKKTPLLSKDPTMSTNQHSASTLSVVTASNSGILYASSSMRDCLVRAEKFAPFNIRIVLKGETGTGKTILAKHIHDKSTRKGDFVTVDCPTIAKELTESELFGHVRGAFTGAVADKPGLCEQAKDGTIFFDEIGDLPLDIQPKLLRFIESGEFRRVGDNVTRKTNARIIVATHVNLEQAVEDKKFREDLYYRIQDTSITLPPLRERPDDILPLAQQFVASAYLELHLLASPLKQDVVNILRNHPWKGNVRELRAVIRTAVFESLGQNGSQISADMVTKLLKKDLSPSKDIKDPFPEFLLDGKRNGAANVDGVSIHLKLSGVESSAVDITVDGSENGLHVPVFLPHGNGTRERQRFTRQ